MASTEQNIGERIDGNGVILDSEPMTPIEEEDSHRDEELKLTEPLTSGSPATEFATETRSSENRNQDGYGFKKWLRSMKGKKNTFAGPQRYVYGWPEDEALDESYRMFRRHDHDNVEASSITSSSILHKVKTASMSFTSLSSANRFLTSTRTSTRQSGNHSSGLSGSEPRVSIDSNGLNSALSLDERAWNRAVQRRQVIGEILDTETTYVAGLKALTDILSTMVVTRSGLHQSADDLLSLHENLLSKLHGLTTRSNVSTPFKMKGWVGKRRRSGMKGFNPRIEGPDRKVLASRKLREPIEARVKASKSIAAEPREAAEVAGLLFSMLPEFSAYKDYGLKYQLAIKEIEVFRKSLTNSESMDHGVEALVKSTAPSSTRQLYANQGLTLADLLLKPIQRVCKYQLFLTDLLKDTPVADCPSSHETIDRVLQRVIEVVQEVNRGTGDPIAKDRLQKTILLQDMIEFPRERTGEREILRDFGHVKVCGALHVAYETRERVIGEYMMFCLFTTHLVLATLHEKSHKFGVAAIIRTCDIEVKEPDEGPGLCCERTPYSWKIVFRSGKDYFELLVSACSEKEAREWKENLLLRSEDENKPELSETTPFLQRSCALVAQKPKYAADIVNCRSGVDRRLSSATVLPPYPSVARVELIIKGTEALPATGNCNTSLRRSRSLQTDRQIAVLEPKRQDRIRMERRLSLIWTRDVLPYPGMQTGRGEHIIRTSAESLLRKFSRRKPFVRLGSPGTIAAIKKRSTDSLLLSKEDQALNEHDEIELVDIVPEPDRGSQAEEKHDNDAPATPTSSYSSRSGGKRKPHMIQDEARIRECKPGLRKKLSLSLFGSIPSHGAMRRAAAVGH